MHRIVRIGSLVLVASGVLALAWVVVVWQWQDPFTALYTLWQQDKLEGQLSQEFREYGMPHRSGPALTSATAEADAIGRAAVRLRRAARPGEAIGRIVIPRLGLNMILVNGTDDASLRLGPGRDERTYMPGQNRLVYIAGHRTTYLAPFANIDQIVSGDPITLEMPYATFVYRAVRHKIVAATDLAVLRSPRHELLELQACNPRFFATQRWIVYAHLVNVEPRDGPSLSGRRLRTLLRPARPRGSSQ